MTNFVHHETKKPRPHIALHEVKSSQVKSVGYDHGSNTLAVSFTRGAGTVYHYPGVSAAQHEALVKSDSIGAHFGKHIKHLPFEKYVPHKA